MKLITLSVNKFVTYVLRDNSFVAIDKDLAELLVHLQQGQGVYHVQFPSVDNDNTNILLWRYADWCVSVETWRQAKARSERERVDRWIREKNISIISRSIMRYACVSEDASRLLANRWLSRGDKLRWELIGVTKLAQTEKDL